MHTPFHGSNLLDVRLSRHWLSSLVDMMKVLYRDSDKLNMSQRFQSVFYY